MLLTETHLHTSEVSACASATGAYQAAQYKEAGYNTIIVTDHFLNGNTTVDRSLPWEQQVEQFCLGYEHAKQAGDELGLNVLFGLEYAWSGCDLLVYGVDKKWLLKNPDCVDISVHEFCDRVHSAGGVIVHAHPFREANYIRDMKFLPLYTDAVEVCNAGNRLAEWNDRANWYADQYGFVKTAGSDCHHATPYSPSKYFGIFTANEIVTMHDFIRTIKYNEIESLKYI